MASDAAETQWSSDVKTIKEFIDIALQDTRQRLTQLGIDEQALLDPEASIDQQVAMLRLLFLEAEQTCLAINSTESNFWKVLKARLQPVVLAYLTHEKFVQTLDMEARELRPDTLLQVYKERLSNSDRFRSFFFDLDSRLKLEAAKLIEADDSGFQPKPRLDRRHSSADMEKNILSSLEKQLQDLERKYNQQEKSLQESEKRVAGLKQALEEKDLKIEALRKDNAALEEHNAQLRLAANAQGHAEQHKKNVEVEILTGQDAFSDLVLDADQEQLLLKIEALERELATTSDAAYNAFMANSDMGIIILFMLTSFRCRTHEQLAAELIKSINAFGLNSIIGFRRGDGYVFYPESASGQDLVAQLEHRIPAAKLVESPHLMLFEEDCCLLIQDPPLQDEERFAGLKDHLGSLLRGVQARYVSILTETSVQKQKTQVDALVIRSHEVFKTFERNLDKQKDKMSRAINLVGQELRKSLGIKPGDQNSIRLNMDLKKLEDMLGDLFVQSELVDPAFKKNISRVAENLSSKSKPGS